MIGNITSTSNSNIQLNADINPEDLEALNQLFEQSVGTDINWSIQMLGFIWLWINIIYLLIFIFSAIGLYKLSKKLGDKHSWLAFIPLIQIYTLIKTAWYSFWKWFFMLIGFWFLAMILWWIATVWLWSLLTPLFWDSLLIRMYIAIISWFILIMMMLLISTFFLYSWMAKRANQSGGTALLMALFPWCMLWIVANRIEQVQTRDPQVWGNKANQDFDWNSEL